jgi:lipopolysaccharide transport system ATP-binding protein
MSATVISVQNVSKCYRLGLIGGGTLRADFERWWARVRGKPDPLLKIGQGKQNNRQGEYIWALREVSFEVKEGEVLGIIGRNGAGKSTLLKILSRVTAPTAGQVKVKGRVASLLEVGTGFHPELTGRENIYLNGVILGMKKAEIDRKFDEIVAFAEIENFMDTPVKRYSSGMYVRLAFAVAAHLDPDILLVDEVLSVGDIAFQEKCLNKMQTVSLSARTVLFVSHNMGAIRRLCPRTLLVQGGKIAFWGATEIAVTTYQSSCLERYEESSGRFERDLDNEPPTRATWVQVVELRDGQGKLRTKFRYGEDMRIVFELGGQPAREGMTLTWILHDPRGAPIAWGNSMLLCGFHLKKGENHVICTLKHLPLAVGRYSFTFSGGILSSPEPKDYWRDAATFEVEQCDPFSVRSDHLSTPGAVVLDQAWGYEE